MLLFQLFISIAVAKKTLIIGGSGEFTSNLDIILNNGTIELSDREAMSELGGGTAKSYQWHCSVLFRGEPYIIGGFPTTYYEQVIKYNGFYWIQVERLPEPIFGQTCGVFDDRIWVCAGKHILGYSNRKCFLFDGEHWSSMNSYQARSLRPAGAVLQDAFYQIGGAHESDQKTPLRTVEKCTLTGCVQSSLYPKPINMASAVSVNGTIFVFGGYDGEDLLREIYSFGSFSAAWRHVGNLNRQRAGHLVLALGQSNFPIFLIFGGKNKNGEPKCEIFNPLVSRRSQEFSIPELDGRRIGASTVVLESYP